MNSKTSRKIKKLVDDHDLDMLASIQKVYGYRTKTMNRNQVIKAAKKLWSKCKGDWKQCNK